MNQERQERQDTAFTDQHRGVADLRQPPVSPPDRRQYRRPNVFRLALDSPSDGVHLAAQGIDLVK